MKKRLNFTALAFTGLMLLTSARGADAQYMYNYSSNIWVNSGMNLLFQKRWATARIRAAGKNQLADALEGRRTNGGGSKTNGAQTSRQADGRQETENFLRRAPLNATAFKSTSATIIPSVYAAQFADRNSEEARTMLRAST